MYQPGVCNIGPAEIRQRRALGYVGFAGTVVFLVLAFALGWSTVWRLFVVVPAAASAMGFLQAQLHFCSGFGARGLFNFGELGAGESVLEAEFRRKDQRTAARIVALSLAIGIVIALVAWLIP